MDTPPPAASPSLTVPKVIALVVAVGLGAFYVGMRTGQSPGPSASSGGPATGAPGESGPRGPSLDELKPRITVPDAPDLAPSSKSLLGTGSPGSTLKGRPQPPPKAPEQTAPSR